MDQVSIYFFASFNQIGHGSYIGLPASFLVRLTLINLGHGRSIDDDIRLMPLEAVYHILFIGDVQ